MTMPSPGTSLHLASLDYQCTFGQLLSGAGLVAFSCPDPVHFTFSFETGSVPVAGQPGVVQMSWDYSWFDQAVVEAELGQALGQIAASIAQLLSLSLASVCQVVAVRRMWLFAPNVQGPGASSGRVVITNVMPYPPGTGADAAQAAESARGGMRPGQDSARAADRALCAWPSGADAAQAAESAHV